MKPKIRFKGFDDAYYENKFSQLFNTISDSGHNVSSNEYCKRGTYPVIDQSKDYIVGYTDVVAPIIPKGGIIVFGDHTRELKYVDFPFCTGADGTQLLSPKSKDIPMYLYYYCKSLKIPNTGYNRHFKYIKETIYNIPLSTKEQQVIASFFDNIDSQISASASRIASLKQIKAASLQAMFPLEGETVPKVRFKGFKGEWKKVKLGNIFCERNESNINGEMLSVTQRNGIIKASENGRFDNSNSDKSNYKVVKVGDIAYNSMRMWQGASGYSPYEGIVSPAYTVIIPQEGIYSPFFAYLFKNENIINTFRLHSQGLTSDTWNLKFPAFSKIEILFPEDAEMKEQQKIAVYFTSLDRQISLHSQRLEKLKQIKAACLDKMFV